MEFVIGSFLFGVLLYLASLCFKKKNIFAKSQKTSHYVEGTNCENEKITNHVNFDFNGVKALDEIDLQKSIQYLQKVVPAEINLSKIEDWQVIGRGSRPNQTESNVDFECFFPKGGSNIIRILPPCIRNKRLWHTQQQHYVEHTKKVIQCCKTYDFHSHKFNGECPLCELHKDIDSKHYESCKNNNIAKKTQPSTRYYYNVLVKNKDTNEWNNTPQLWSCGLIVHRQIEHLMNIQKIDLTGYNNGHDINLIRTQSGKIPTYQVTPIKESRAIDRAVREQILKTQIDIQGLIDGPWKIPKDEVQLVANQLRSQLDKPKIKHNKDNCNDDFFSQLARM